MAMFAFVLAAVVQAADPSAYFAIEVVDAETGRGVPLVELETVNHQRFVTDSNGLIAFSEPGLMDRTVFFHVRAHGYEFPADGFGIRGTRLDVAAGGEARIEVKRINVAERLYRVTGAGIYRETILLGRQAPIAHPLLNAQVFGSDSVVCASYQGRIHWFWGDTNRPAYPLGNFHVPGATSTMPSEGGLDPSVGVDLEYFVGPDGFARPTARMPGEGPTWISPLVVLNDAEGRERMFAHYVKVRNFLEVYEWGLLRWRDDANEFEKVATFPLTAAIQPHGAHAFLATDADGVEYVYFASPYPHQRVRATPEALADWSQYEAYTCLQAGTTINAAQLDRDEGGRVRYAWRRNTPAVEYDVQQRWIDQNLLRPGEAIRNLRDIETGRPVVAHRGSVYWNEFRQRWIMIFNQRGGEPSHLGEVWYAEAEQPTGPWLHARRIVTHDKYSFYNPKQHPFFDQQGGRIVFFEGTYTQSFSASPSATPLYDYNQIMYRMDLGDPRLNLPVPMRLESAGRDEVPARPSFCALERAAEGSIAIFACRNAKGQQVLLREPAEGSTCEPAFHAQPASGSRPASGLVRLYEFTRDDRQPAYGPWAALPGYRRAERPLCLVWEYPYEIDWPD